jgi:hypothetical protein
MGEGGGRSDHMEEGRVRVVSHAGRARLRAARSRSGAARSGARGEGAGQLGWVSRGGR